MTNKIIDKLVDLSVYYGRIKFEWDNFELEYIKNSGEVSEKSKKDYEKLDKMKEKLKAQIEILKEVLENDR